MTKPLVRMSISSKSTMCKKYFLGKTYTIPTMSITFSENMKTVGPSVRNRQIFGRTDKFLNLSVRLTDKKMPIILQWFDAEPMKNRPDRQYIGLVGPADRQKFDDFHILCILFPS